MKNQELKCPNCGAKVSENTAKCAYCNFVLADKNAIQQIDDSILQIENSILELNKFSAISLKELALILNVISFLIINIAYYIDVESLNLFFVTIEIILIASVFINRYTRRFVFRFIPTKRTCKNNLNEFSKLYPQNTKLEELRQNFNIRIEIINKKIWKNAIITTIIFVFIFAGLFSLRFISSDNNLDIDFMDTTICIHPKEIIINSKYAENIQILDKDFDIIFTKNKRGILMELKPITLSLVDSTMIEHFSFFNIKISLANEKGEILSVKNETGQIIFFPPFEENEFFIDSLIQKIETDSYFHKKNQVDDYIKLLETTQNCILIIECNSKSWEEPFF